MVTKVFVSQIDEAQQNGAPADNYSIIRIVNGNTVWFSGEFENGILGASGEVGYRGSQGDTGYLGSLGALGYIGSLGIIGFQGSAGYTLTSGEGGYSGSSGETGYAGSRGITGYSGSFGEVGYVGSPGEYAFTGSVGVIGSQGASGFIGSKGDIGYVGSLGIFVPGGFNFNQFLDLSPNTYTAHSLITVNTNASGITQLSNTYYVTSGYASANLNFPVPNYPDTSYLNYPAISSYSETFSSISSSTGSGAITLDFSKGRIFNILLDTATSTVNGPGQGDLEFRGHVITATLYIKQDGTGNRKISWWSNIYWPVGEGIAPSPDGPVLSTIPNTTDVITLTTFDGMATWYGAMIGKTFY